MSLFCFCAGILSLAYYVLIVVYAGITADFAWFWVLLTAVLEGGAVLIRYGRNHPGIFPGWLGTVIMVAVLIGIVCFGFICSCVISGMKSSGKKNLDYVVVLGAHVKGDVPSKALSAGKDQRGIFILPGIFQCRLQTKFQGLGWYISFYMSA